MRSQKSRRLGWTLVAVGCLAWLSIGCSPASLSMLLMPFSDNKIDPEYKLFAASKELKLVILSNFSNPEFREDVLAAENELADRVAEYMRKRCTENSHKIKIVSQVEVRNFQQKEGTTGDLFAKEVGKKFKADYVLDLNIQSMNLYEKNTFPKMFRGTTQIAVSLYKIDGKDGEQKPFSKLIQSEYPGARGPIPADNSSASAFRNLFLTKVSRDLTKLLIAFPPEERMMMD